MHLNDDHKLTVINATCKVNIFIYSLDSYT